MLSVCGICERESTTPGTYTQHFVRDGLGFMVEGLQGNYCLYCDDFTIDRQQAIANQVLIKQAHELAKANAGRGGG